MGNIYKVKGNVLDGGYDVVFHQANCQIQMGAGIAREIRLRYPKVYEADKNFKYPKGKARLGKYSFARVKHDKTGNEFFIVNVYGQNDWKGSGPKGDGVRTEYSHLKKGIKDAVVFIKENYPEVKSFAVPYLMGCALGGGDWNEVYNDLSSIVSELDIDLYISEFRP